MQNVRRIMALGLIGLLAACSEGKPPVQQVDFPTPVAKPKPPTVKTQEILQSNRNRAEAMAKAYQIKLYAATPDYPRTVELVQLFRQHAAYLNDHHPDYSRVAVELTFRYNGTVQRLLVPLQRGNDRFVPLKRALGRLLRADTEADSFRFVTLSNQVDLLKVHAAIAKMEQELTAHPETEHAPRFFALARQVDLIYNQLAPKPYEGSAATRTFYALDAAELFYARHNYKASRAALKDADKALSEMLTQYGKTPEEQLMLDQLSQRIIVLQQALNKRNPTMLGAISSEVKSWLTRQANDE